jgi:hypothetical protein
VFAGAPMARYFRITGSDRWNMDWGNSIWEVRLYAK